ncbi:29 kDa ribonucleoprotein A, chloroplastic [Vitis vinifera]|uniref:29 kDa ribonucleoprotein A, chloroplastic n=1 Tax=Vitis vinifera TaxID=29760 RepID=A0A438HZZ4_VITVI|nr:29 kDa ribonucleoprotein A, chloroplastic [Vitis vinifera]
MAATAAAAIGSSFSTTMHTLKLSRSKHCPSDALLRIISTPIFKEEAAATAPVEEEQQQGQEEGEQVLREEGAESPVNTKLYFGTCLIAVTVPIWLELFKTMAVQNSLSWHSSFAGADCRRIWRLMPLCQYEKNTKQGKGKSTLVIKVHSRNHIDVVLYDRDTGRSRGFAFVTMSSVEDCNAVIENLDGSEYGGRTLRVNFSDKPKPKLPLYPETEYKLFVGNLSWSVTSESLNQVFQEYGNVIGARVLYDGETGRSRGYGFVCYSTKAEMDTALESLNGVELEGRAIRISLAQGRRS